MGRYEKLSQFTMSVPSFFLGIIIIYLFGLIMRWFTPGGYISYKEDFRGYIRYMLFPAITVALPKAAMTAKFLRNSIITQLKSDYVRTAYSKGARRMRVLFVHVLRNAMIPVVTFIGVIAAEIAAGSIVVEQVFGLPGWKNSEVYEEKQTYKCIFYIRCSYHCAVYYFDAHRTHTYAL